MLAIAPSLVALLQYRPASSGRANTESITPIPSQISGARICGLMAKYEVMTAAKE
jgi:hypothetical protein